MNKKNPNFSFKKWYRCRGFEPAISRCGEKCTGIRLASQYGMDQFIPVGIQSRIGFMLLYGATGLPRGSPIVEVSNQRSPDCGENVYPLD